MKKYLTILLLGSVLALQAQTTPASDTLNHKKLRAVAISVSGLYVASMAVLYQAWYKDFQGSGFHWADDAGEWLLKDKMGHFTTTYQVGNYGYWMLRNAGLPENKAIWYGGTWGFIYMASIEVLDGFSDGWGASPSDLLANTLGTSLFIAQQAFWHEQRMRLKFSYHPTQYAQYRPDLLGENGWQRIIKDYNGETNWLSINVHDFLKPDNQFPDWFCISLGYGATGMLGAYENPAVYKGNTLPQFKRRSQFYFSVDVDWTKIKTSSKALRTLLRALSFIKIPAPAIELSRDNGFKFHPLYF